MKGCTLLPLLLVTLWAARQRTSSKDSALHRAMQALTIGRPRGAARMLRAELKRKEKRKPGDSHLLRQLALCTIKLWFVRHKWQTVNGLFDEALELATLEDRPHFRRSQLLRDKAEWRRKNGFLRPALEYLAHSLKDLDKALDQGEVANLEYKRELGASLGHLAFIEWQLGRPKEGVVGYWHMADERLLDVDDETVVYRLNAMVRGLKIDKDVKTADGKQAREVALHLATNTSARNQKRVWQIRLVCWRLTRPLFAGR